MKVFVFSIEDDDNQSCWSKSQCQGISFGWWKSNASFLPSCPLRLIKLSWLEGAWLLVVVVFFFLWLLVIFCIFHLILKIQVELFLLSASKRESWGCSTTHFLSCIWFCWIWFDQYTDKVGGQSCTRCNPANSYCAGKQGTWSYVGHLWQKCSHQQKVLVWESHMSCSANEERWIFNWRHRSTWSFCRKSRVTTNIDIISILRSILKALCQHLGFQRQRFQFFLEQNWLKFHLHLSPPFRWPQFSIQVVF